MDLKLKGKRAFVSGSTAGIGFAVALGLAREGAEVVVNGRTDPKVSEAVKRIAGGTAATVSGLAADLGSAAGVDRLLSKLGKVDILVNNIGIFEPKPFLEIPDADWLRFFETL
jgi:NAD(P)-dependent dehydrogenase (short-subunit alcohol dehydrogenase family)